MEGMAATMSAPFDENIHSSPREQHDACAALLSDLRSSPSTVALGLRRAGLLRERCPAHEQEVAAQFLLCSLYGHRSHPLDERALMGLFSCLVRCDPDGNEMEGVAPDRLAKGGLFSHLVVSYLRALPDSAAWLQAAVGKQLARIIDLSDGPGSGSSGSNAPLRLLTGATRARCACSFGCRHASSSSSRSSAEVAKKRSRCRRSRTLCARRGRAY